MLWLGLNIQTWCSRWVDHWSIGFITRLFGPRFRLAVGTLVPHGKAGVFTSNLYKTSPPNVCEMKLSRGVFRWR